jgi:hypothetical protein
VLTTAIAVWSEPTQANSTASSGANASASATATGHQVHFGIAYGSSLLGAPAAELDSELDDAANLGAKWVRVDLPWTVVEPYDTGTYDWSSFDALVSAARARHLNVDPILDQVPEWARRSSCRTDYNCPPTDDSQFAAFAGAAAAHFGPMGVDTWEIWNEPNIAAWYPNPDPAAYDQLLVDTSKAIRAVQPHAFLVLGGLAAVPTNPSQHYMSAYDFIAAVGKLGGTHYVNAVGYHPYSLPVMPSAATNFANISSTPYNLISALSMAGTPSVSIWITESGASVTAASTDPSAAQAVTQQAEQVQAAYATDLVQTVAANAHVDADFWYADQDDPPDKLYYGLRRSNGSLRPAFDALKTAIAQCGCNAGN